MMKPIITALGLASLVAAAAATQSATAAPWDRPDASQIDRSYNGTYQGAPLREWYRGDNW
jgi:hypothetical protein